MELSLQEQSVEIADFTQENYTHRPKGEDSSQPDCKPSKETDPRHAGHAIVEFRLDRII